METHSEQDLVLSLERRISALERTVAGLVAAVEASRAPAAPRATVPPASAVPSAPQSAPSGGVTAKSSAPPVRVPASVSLGGLAPASARAEPGFDMEQWLGARGLLLVGVVALLTAAGFFLKYAFDRGWVAPGVRVLGAVLAGIAVAVYGERQVRAEMRRFGLALAGAGGGLVYLGIWAAAGPYGLISRPAGILAIVVTAAAAAWRAVRHDAEALALWALLGAFMAPVLLRSPEPNPQFFLAYLAVVGFATAGVARVMTWRLALIAGLGGGLALVLSLVPDVLHTPLGFLYLTASGIVALYVPPRAWIELRVVGPLVVWIVFVVAAVSVRPGASWVAELGALSVLLAAWWQHRGVAAFRARQFTLASADDAQTGFVASPIAFAMIAALAGGMFLRDRPELPFAAVAAFYLATGWRGRWAAFVALGWALAAVALVLAFSDADVILAFSAAIVVGAAADRWQDQLGMAPVTLLLIVLAGLGLLAGLASRQTGEPAFVGAWSTAFYAYVAAVALAASWWRTGSDRAAWARKARGTAWAAVGAVVFAGLSLELKRLFDLKREAWPGASLAGDLAISVWWLLYAALLVRIGFSKDVREVRWAGLAVAALAALKITFVDLSTLEALYRVAAFFVLALIALGVAYAYNRRARGAAAPSAPGS